MKMGVMEHANRKAMENFDSQRKAAEAAMS